MCGARGLRFEVGGFGFRGSGFRALGFGFRAPVFGVPVLRFVISGSGDRSFEFEI